VATNQQRRESAKRKLERQLVRRAERARRRKIIGLGVTVGVVILVAGVVVFFVTRSNDDASAAPPSPIQIPTQRVAEPTRSPALANPVTCQYPSSSTPPSKPVNPPSGDKISSSGKVEVTLQSTAGDIPITLDRALAPCAVNSFISLAKQGFYTGSECPRLGTSGLQMLQCGDPAGIGGPGPGYTFKDELFDGVQYGRGVLAMANSGPDSNGSQFFMVYGNAELSPAYTVFGSISDAGLQVLDKVARAGDDGQYDVSPDGTPGPGGGKPNTQVKFTGVLVNG
jgi:peptidyl-prolyl cis-trans isomerase B (cyclophilin B)